MQSRGDVVLASFGVIPVDSLAVFVKIAKEELRIGISLGRGGVEPLKGGGVVGGGGIVA